MLWRRGRTRLTGPYVAPRHVAPRRRVHRARPAHSMLAARELEIELANRGRFTPLAI